MKKLWNSLKGIILSYTVQYIIMVVGIIIFSVISGNVEYLNDAVMVYEMTIFSAAVTSIPIVIFLLNKYKFKGDKINTKKLLLMIPLGLCVSLFYNMLTISFMTEQAIEINNIILYSYVVIIGPIFEEVVFRYLGLNAAKKAYPLKKAIVIVSLAFAFMHSGINNMIYAFLIGILLSNIYNNYKNIMYPIVLHISANLMSVLITGFNIYALVISGIGLLLLYLYLKREKHV